MSKLDVEFALTGLTFKISGERDDVSGALAKLQHQVASLMQSVSSTAGTLGGSVPSQQDLTRPQTTVTVDANQKSLTSGRGGRSRRNGATGKRSGEAIDFQHDPEKFGYPKQDWNTAQKSMWLLFVLEAQNVTKEATAGALATTFNKHFKEFGTILAPNVTRDLGAKKKAGQVGNDVTKDPQTWYLLAGGKTAMSELCKSNATFETSPISS